MTLILMNMIILIKLSISFKERNMRNLELYEKLKNHFEWLEAYLEQEVNPEKFLKMIALIMIIILILIIGNTLMILLRVLNWC